MAVVLPAAFMHDSLSGCLSGTGALPLVVHEAGNTGAFL